MADADPRAALEETRTERWYCGVYESGYHNGARCSPGDAHTASRWGCGYRYVYSGEELYAALTAVLDMGPSIIETGGEEDPNFATGYNSGYEDALADIRTAITAHLAQSERR